MRPRKLPPLSWATVALLLVAASVIALYASMGRSFQQIAPGYAQHLYGVSSLRSNQFSLGGVVVLQDNTVISAECRGPQTKLHVFDPGATFTKFDTILHQENNPIPTITGGCGIAFENVGGQSYIFSNLNDASSSDGDGTFGVARIAWPAQTVTKMAAGFPGNGLGIAVDPQTGDLIYVGAACRLTNPLPTICPLYRFNPSTGGVTTFAALPGAAFAFIDGIAFEPTTGNYLFITNRTTPSGELDVVNRAGIVVSRTPLVNTATTGMDPVGIGFHGSPSFVVTNNQDATMTEYDYPGGYELPAVPKLFASGGSRGDMIQAGPDGCLYVTQLQTVYNDPTKTDNFNSIVQICGGFVPPPGITPNPPPAPASLCGFVYHDASGNGTKDAAETGIAGVTVTLSGSDYLDLPVSASTATAGDGSYCFKNLQAGKYTITETQPAGYLDGKDVQGTPGTGTTGNDTFTNIRLDAGVNGANNNFGELLTSSLAGFVYLDADNNGLKGSAEAGIAGVAITLAGTDDLGAAVNLAATTGSDGAYAFMSLGPGTYTLTETQPAAYTDGKDTQGTPGTGTPGNDTFTNIVLGSGVNGADNNFGEMQTQPSSLAGFVYADADNNGVKGSAEAGIAGVNITLTGTNDLGAAVSLSTTTGVGGAYAFMGLRPGTYTLTETQPAGYTDGKDTQGTPGTGTTANDAFTNIVLGPGVNGANNNFGEIPPPSDTQPPTCTIDVKKGPPLKVTMTFRDSGSGIARFEIVDAINLTIGMPTFTAPSHGPLVVTGTRINARKSDGMTIRAIDAAGNQMLCDPVSTTVTRLKHEKGVQTFDNIADAEHFVTVENDNPGLRRLDVVVNGQTFKVKKLDDYEIVLIDIASAMQLGPVNTITLVPYGKKGDSALVTIADH